MSELWKDNDEPDDTVLYGLVWLFIDQSPAFALGVEAGILYERMHRREETILSTTHSENEEELRRLASSMGYRAQFSTFDETGQWQGATFTRDAA